MLGEIAESVFQGVLLLPLRLLFWLDFSIKVSCRSSVMMKFAFVWAECTCLLYYVCLHILTNNTVLKCNYFDKQIHHFYDLSLKINHR